METTKDALDTFADQANADPRRAVMLLLWKNRHANPDMVATISEKEITGFDASCAYLQAEPDVRIVRPQGRPATVAIPAQGKRRAVAASAGEPPRPYVVVSLVKKGTSDQIKPIENNEGDAQLRDQANHLRKVRESAAGLAAELLAGVSRNEYSAATIREAAGALVTLAKG